VTTIISPLRSLSGLLPCAAAQRLDRGIERRLGDQMKGPLENNSEQWPLRLRASAYFACVVAAPCVKAACTSWAICLAPSALG
jgi:hypothetical protein